MGINCDVCGKNCTPKNKTTMLDDDDGEDTFPQHSVIEIQDIDFYVCGDCEEAIFHWLKSDECKAYCKKAIQE